MADPARPTRIRYIILSLTTCIAVMLYLDRWCLGFFAPHIRDQFRLSGADVDWLQGTFFVSYALGQIPCGWLADRFGPRAMLTLYLVTWSALTGTMGVATSLGMLMLFRLGCGLFEAGAYPASAGLIRRWMPYSQRGLGSAIVSLGGRIGGAIAFPLSAYFMVAFATTSRTPEFMARDIVAPREIARELIDPAVPQSGSFGAVLAEHVRPRLTEAQHSLLQAIATETAASSTAVDQLLGLLNELLHQSDLVAGIDLQPFTAKIPPEALRLATPGATPPSEADLVLRNRLLLEVALPNRVCKLYGWGWQRTLAIFGVVGVVLALVFLLFFRNQPHEHPLVNAAEAQLIEGGEIKKQAADAPMPAGDVWRGILTSRSLWLASFVQVGTNFGWVFIGTKMPEYLEKVHQVPTIEQGWMVFLPFLLSVPMTLVGGSWTDWMARRWGPYLGRAFPIASTRFVAAAGFLACVMLHAPWPITVAMCVISVSSDMGLPALWAYNLDVGGRNVGVVLGWGNMWGNGLGAAASPIVLGYIQVNYGWDAVFLTCAATFVLIGIASFGIDATRPIGTRSDGASSAV